MKMRSWLFAPGDSAKKMSKAVDGSADVVIFDLEDAVATANKPLARLVTINSALEVDLTGQVNAEASGSTYLGGTGSQVDFVRAGARSPGGHAIIAFSATAKGGALSKIVPALSGPVTTARTEVDVAVITIDRPEQRNCLSREVREGLRTARARFEDDADAKIAVLTGSGEKAFCAGGRPQGNGRDRLKSSSARHVPGAF